MRVLVRGVAEKRITYGYRRIWAVLRKQQRVLVSRKRVRRILKEEGLLREVHFPRPRLPATGNQAATEPNRLWMSDITYIDTTDRGPVGMITVEDTCTRELLAWDLPLSCGAADAWRVAEQAVLARFPRTGRATGVKLKTDGGSQYNAHDFQDRARQMGLSLETRRKRRPEDGGVIESFNGHFKVDYIYTHEPTTYAETRRAIAEHARDYNEERPHSSLDYLTPAAFYQSKLKEAKE
jgi:putative transposase